MSPRLWTAISVSMIMHAVLWTGNYLRNPQAGRSAPSLFTDSVLLDPSAYEAVRKAREAQSAALLPPKKKRVGIKPSSLPSPKAVPVQEPLPKVEAKVPAVAPFPDQTPSLREALENEKTAHISPRDGVRFVVAAAPQKTGSELMANPKTRGLFADYFGLVKAQIQTKLREKCEGRNVGSGSVALAFVLQSDGRLRQVSVVDRNSEANLLLRELALESLRASAPFSGFPGDFETKQIAFNLTINFDDL